MGRTKRKTGGSLSVDAGDLLFGMIQHIDELLKKFDSLGIKFEKMPSFAKKMADVYVNSFSAITTSIKDLSSKSDKLGSIAAGLGDIAKSTKKFSGTEAQASAIASLSSAMSQLSGSIAKFPKDTSGVTTFTDGIKQLNTAFSRLKPPDDAKISQMNRAANAIRNIADALKSAGGVPPDVMAAFAAATGHGAPGAPTTPPPTGAPPAPPAAPPTPPPPTLREKAMGYAKNAGTAIAGAAIGAGASALLRGDASAASLSQRLPMGEEGYIFKNEGADYTRQMKAAAAAASEGGGKSGRGLSAEGSFQLLEMMAAYSANGNRGTSDMRTMSESERTAKAEYLGANSMILNKRTGLDPGSATDMQLSMERNLGIKSTMFDTLRDTFISLARSSSLTAKDLLVVAEGARDAGSSFIMSGEEAKNFVNKSLIAAAAVSNAGIKQSSIAGNEAGFFGDEEAFLADKIAGITAEDYKDPAALLRKQMASYNKYAGYLPNTPEGNLVAQQVLGSGITPRFIKDMKQGRDLQGKEQARLAQVGASTLNAADPNYYGTENVSFFAAVSQGASGVGAAARGMANTQRDPSAATEESFAPHASGGIVAPGTSGSGDTVPTRLTPGEEVLTKGDPRHKYNLGRMMDYFNDSGYRVTSGFRDANPKSPHAKGRGIDLGMGHLRSEAERVEFRKNLDAKLAYLGLTAHYEKNEQLNPKVGSRSTGDHAHIGGDMSKAAMKLASEGLVGDTVSAKMLAMNERGKGTGIGLNGPMTSAPSLAAAGFSTNPLVSLTNSIAGLVSSQKAQQSSPIQLDPSVMSTLSRIADANSGSSETMADAIGLFASVIRSMASGSRSGSGVNSSHDLITSVARGNYAFSRGA